MVGRDSIPVLQVYQSAKKFWVMPTCEAGSGPGCPSDFTFLEHLHVLNHIQNSLKPHAAAREATSTAL